MKIQTESINTYADFEGRWVVQMHVHKSSVKELCNAVSSLQGMRLDVDIKKHRERRSLDANAYAWVLMGKLAEKTGLPREEIYRETIRNVSANYDVIRVATKRAESVREGWRHNGLGWITDVTSEGNGMTTMLLYRGSSVYDTAQMARLIDLLVYECKEQGIETRPKEEIDSMIAAWGKDGKR